MTRGLNVREDLEVVHKYLGKRWREAPRAEPELEQTPLGASSYCAQGRECQGGGSVTATEEPVSTKTFPERPQVQRGRC